MLALQEEINRSVHPDWRSQAFPWYRAVWIECAELLDQYGWKWWKRQEADREHLVLELVDIWHFGLSMLLLAGYDAPRLARELAEALRDPPAGEFPDLLERFAGRALVERTFDLPLFAALARAVGLEFSELHRRYVAKNVLNRFRQDHGYAEGRYRKEWGGREDNAHLLELACALDGDDPAFPERLYAALAERYRAQGAA